MENILLPGHILQTFIGTLKAAKVNAQHLFIAVYFSYLLHAFNIKHFLQKNADDLMSCEEVTSS